MRTHGNLIKWNDDRGFGFIAPAQGHDEIFVHISAFPRDGTRPHIGEIISFEIEGGSDGKKRAVRILRPGSKASPHRTRSKESSTTKRSPFTAVLGLLAVGAVGAVGVSGYNAFTSRYSGAAAEYATPTVSAAPRQTFRCDGRTRCSQMNSCAEALYFLRNCPNTQMDGDNDGEPCEQQWCN